MPMRGVIATRESGIGEPSRIGQRRALKHARLKCAVDSQRRAQLPGPFVRSTSRRDAAALAHQLDALHRFERAYEHRARLARARVTALKHQCSRR